MRALALLIIAGCGRIGFDPLDGGEPSAQTLAVGQSHACVIRNGSVVCWGRNDEGQLGRGSATISEPVPMSVPGLTDIVQIAACDDAMFATNDRGETWVWGHNSDFNLAESLSGGFELSPRLSPVLPDFVELAGGVGTACGRTHEGDVLCWGDGDGGQLGDGSVSDFGPPVQVSLPGAASNIALGADHGCAIVDARVYCWGVGASGQVGLDPTTLIASCEDRFNIIGPCSPTPVAVPGIANALRVSGGLSHSCALVARGGVRCWGANDGGRLGDGTTTDSFTPVSVSLAGVRHVRVGREASCAVADDGSAYCWGENQDGELGDGMTGTFSALPSRVLVPTRLSTIEMNPSGYFTCGLDEASDVWCWGRNDFGQLGNATSTMSGTPQLIPR